MSAPALSLSYFSSPSFLGVVAFPPPTNPIGSTEPVHRGAPRRVIVRAISPPTHYIPLSSEPGLYTSAHYRAAQLAAEAAHLRKELHSISILYNKLSNDHEQQRKALAAKTRAINVLKSELNAERVRAQQLEKELKAKNEEYLVLRGRLTISQFVHSGARASTVPSPAPSNSAIATTASRR